MTIRSNTLRLRSVFRGSADCIRDGGVAVPQSALRSRMTWTRSPNAWGRRKATMYGSFLCSHCDDQKKLFGPSFRYVPYVECSVRGSRQMTFPCIAAQIRYTPTWIFADGERRTGVQSAEGFERKDGMQAPMKGTESAICRSDAARSGQSCPVSRFIATTPLRPPTIAI